MRSYTAIGRWSASVPQHALVRLGAHVAGTANAPSVQEWPKDSTIPVVSCDFVNAIGCTTSGDTTHRESFRVRA
ncbi:hypothetical protein ACFC1R_20705 [Kitasatospora sp. NPDC056138]|uniref:hypothetical protein n=1 Tax=Kitasatospora sp. NPDC056138 TaxID=3345724 RepID=UPI0035D71C2A